MAGALSLEREARFSSFLDFGEGGSGGKYVVRHVYRGRECPRLRNLGRHQGTGNLAGLHRERVDASARRVIGAHESRAPCLPADGRLPRALDVRNRPGGPWLAS